MTPNQEQQFNNAYERAIKQGIAILGSAFFLANGTRCWRVRGSHGAIYVVEQVNEHHLICSCPAGQHGRYCKHRALITKYLMAHQE